MGKGTDEGGPAQNQIQLPQLHGPTSVGPTVDFAGSGPPSLLPPHFSNLEAAKKRRLTEAQTNKKLESFER